MRAYDGYVTLRVGTRGEGNDIWWPVATLTVSPEELDSLIEQAREVLDVEVRDEQ